MNGTLKFQLSTLFFLQFFIWGSWYVTLGTYLLQTLEFNGREVGLIYGATAIAATVSPFLSGILADRLFSTEKILSVLHFSGGLVMFYISTLQEFALFYPLLIFYSLLYMPTFALASALTFFHVSDSTKDFPKVRVWGTIGWIIAGLVVSYLQIEAEASPMQISAGSSLVMAFYCFFLPKTPPQAQQNRLTLKTIIGPEIIDLLKQRRFFILILCMALIAIPSGFYYSFTNPFLNEIGVSNAAGKMSIGQISEIVLMLLLPWFFARIRFKWIIAMGLFVWGFRYALFAMGDSADDMALLYFSIILHGIAYGFSFLTTQIYVDRIVPPQIRSTAQGFITLITMGFGVLAGSYFAGEVVKWYTFADGTHNWQAIWLIPAIFGGAVTILFLVLFKDKDHEKRPI